MIDRRMRRLPRITVWLAAALIAVAGGCGKGREPVYPVTGQVLVKGAPADGAFVVFHPQDTAEKEPPRPFATTDADGTFRLTTFATGDGAPAGKYRVTVVWRPKPTSSLAPEGPDRLKGRYEKAETSGLQAQVEKKATTLEPFRLAPP